MTDPAHDPHSEAPQDQFPDLPGRDAALSSAGSPRSSAPSAGVEINPSIAKDPGSPLTLVLSITLAVILYLVTAILQNLPADEAVDPETRAGQVEQGDTPSAATEPSQTDATSESPSIPAVTPPSFDQFVLTAKLVAKLRTWTRSDPNSLPTLDKLAVREVDKVRMVVVAAEYANAAQARERISTLSEQLEPDSPLLEDLSLLARVYAPSSDASGSESGLFPTAQSDALVGTGGRPVAGMDALTEDERTRLIAHHGWFGEVALSAGMDDDAPERLALLGGGMATAIFFTAAGLLIVTAFVSGFVLLIIGVVLKAMGRLRSRMPVPQRGGSVYIETFAIFVGGFLLIKLGLEPAINAGLLPHWFPIFANWLLLPIIFWPVVRGMSLARWRGTVGLHAGKGLFREIGWGVVCYLAGLPLYAVAVLLVLLLTFLKTTFFGGGDEAPPSNPIVELLGGAPMWVMVAIFALATVWAPLVEETIFRGGLYRAGRSYMHPVVVALGVGILFAFMHNYGPLLTPPLIALGVVFAMMREWRGSLVAPITAHALHNGTVITLMLTMMKVLDL